MKSTTAGLPKCVRFSHNQTRHYRNAKKNTVTITRNVNSAMVKVSKLDEKLPIVEVSPFRKKVWKRCKSYVEDTERSQSAADVPTKGSEDFNFSDTGYPDPNKVTPLETLCPRAATVYGERRRKNKSAMRSHEPKVFYNPANGFATLGARQKSTLEDISSGESLNTYFSLLPRTRPETDGSIDNTIRVQGQRFQDVCPKSRVFCLEPWRHGMTQRKLASAPDGGAAANDLLLRMDHVTTVYRDEVIYDAFERSHTLPSIRIEKTPLKRKRRRMEARIPSGKMNSLEPQAHHSGVQNTLDVMRQSGRPLGLERQLSLELKYSLQNLRRGRARAFPEVVLPSRSTLSLSRSSTIGETMLHIGKSTNSPVIKKQNVNKTTKANSRGSSNDVLFSRDEHERTSTERLKNRHEQSGSKEISSRLRRVSVIEPADSVIAEEEITEDNAYGPKNNSFNEYKNFEGSTLLEKMIDQVQETNNMVLSPLDAKDLVNNLSPDQDSGNDPDFLPPGSEGKAKGIEIRVNMGSEGDKDSGLDNECETVKSDNEVMSHGESIVEVQSRNRDKDTKSSLDLLAGDVPLASDKISHKYHEQQREKTLEINNDIPIDNDKTAPAADQKSQSSHANKFQENVQSVSEDEHSSNDNGENDNKRRGHFNDAEKSDGLGLPKSSSTDSISSVDDTGHPMVNPGAQSTANSS